MVYDQKDPGCVRFRRCQEMALSLYEPASREERPKRPRVKAMSEPHRSREHLVALDEITLIEEPNGAFLRDGRHLLHLLWSGEAELKVLGQERRHRNPKVYKSCRKALLSLQVNRTTQRKAGNYAAAGNTNKLLKVSQSQVRRDMLDYI